MTVIKKYKDADFSTWPDKISEDLFNDWLAIRKDKRAPLTQRAVNGLKGHLLDLLINHRITPEMACHVMVNKGWQSLKYAWVVEELKEDLISGGMGGCMISDIEGFDNVDIASIYNYNEYQR